MVVQIYFVGLPAVTVPSGLVSCIVASRQGALGAACFLSQRDDGFASFRFVSCRFCRFVLRMCRAVLL